MKMQDARDDLHALGWTLGLVEKKAIECWEATAFTGLGEPSMTVIHYTRAQVLDRLVDTVRRRVRKERQENQP